MPTDFVANWLSFLGRTTYHWSFLPEPAVPEDRDFIRVWLGLACLITTITLMYWFASIIPETGRNVASFINTTVEADGWLKGFFYVLHFTIWLVLSPMPVGLLYRLKCWAGIWPLVGIFLIWVLVAGLVKSGNPMATHIMLIALLITPSIMCPKPR